MKRLLLLLIYFGVFPALVNAQEGTITEEGMENLKTYEDTIALLSYGVVNDSTPEHRFAATKKLIPILVEALKTPNSFHYPFARAQAISIQYPADSTFRIFSWQLYVNEDEYRYYGAIQMNQEKLKLYPLIDRSQETAGMDLEQLVLSPEKWYGAIYYNLKQFETPQGMQYLLFGYDAYSFFNKRKLVEVLTFTPEGPRFGGPVFVEPQRDGSEIVRNRLLLEYGSEASVRLNYDEMMDMIVFDHLILMGGLYKENQAPTYVPDGSYDGYKLENGIWVHQPKLFREVSEQPPRPMPILDDDKKQNIFGGKREN